MSSNEYIESRCDECGTALVQLSGDWFCPDCTESNSFQLVPDSDEFSL